MAGDDDADGVLAVGEPDRAGCAGRPDAVGELPVRDRLAVRDAPELAPDAALERRAVQVQRQVELGDLAREVGGQLAFGLCEGRVVGFAEGLLGRAVTLLGHVEAAEGAVGGDEGERAVRAVEAGVYAHGAVFR